MSPPRADGGPYRVVLADDEPRLLDALRALLESTGQIEVIALAESAGGAEHVAREHEPDAVVLDVHMPGGGLQAAERLRQLLPELRIVMLTADETPAVRAAASAAGADAVLSKAGDDDIAAAVLGEAERAREGRITDARAAEEG